jgi:hypothetical protein
MWARRCAVVKRVLSMGVVCSAALGRRRDAAVGEVAGGSKRAMRGETVSPSKGFHGD